MNQAANELSNRLGQFRLLAKLGKGGMADVFVCVREDASSLGRLMVLKLLREDVASDPDAVAMFLDEARLSSRLHHPNVVQVYEAGITDGRYAILMEYLNGVSLAQLRRMASKEKLPFPLRLSVRVLSDALRGLNHAHELKDGEGEPLSLVHRDFTASNVFTTVDGQTKVLDFGIAKARDRSSQTRTGMLKGTARYMAPEAILAKTVDRRADVYSAGVLLWELIAGQKFWRELDYVAVLQKTASGELPPWPEDRELPEALVAVAEKALSHEAEDRYESADELRCAMRKAMDELGGLAEVEEVGRYVTDLAGTECADRQRKCVALAESGNEATLSSTAFPTFSTGEVSTSQQMDGSIVTPTQPLSATQQVPTAQSKWMPIAMAAVALLALASAGVVVFGDRSAPPPPVAASAPTVTQPEPAPAVAEEETHVRLVAAVTPPEATLYLDDRMLPGNPVNIQVPIDDGSHVVRAVLNGYETAEQTVRLDADVAITLSLSPVPAAEGDSEMARRPRPRVTRRTATPTAPPVAAPPAAEPVQETPPRESTMRRSGIERPRASGARMLDEVNPWAD